MSTKIDGVRMKLEPIDLDKDGIIHETETVKTHQEQGVTQIKESTELGDVLDHQTKDIENTERLSSVDFISNINNFQHAPISAVEFIASAGVISRRSRLISRIIKRNAVSIDAMGRKQNVEVAVGKRENDVRKAGMKNVADSPPPR